MRWAILSAWRFLGNWGGWINGCAVAVGEESNCQLPPRWLEVKRTAKWGGCPPLLPFGVVRTVAACSCHWDFLGICMSEDPNLIVLAPFLRVCWIQHSRHSRFTYPPPVASQVSPPRSCSTTMWTGKAWNPWGKIEHLPDDFRYKAPLSSRISHVYYRYIIQPMKYLIRYLLNNDSPL